MRLFFMASLHSAIISFSGGNSTITKIIERIGLIQMIVLLEADLNIRPHAYDYL